MSWQPRHTRLTLLLAALACGGIAAFLVLMGLRENVTYFYAPSDVLAKEQELIEGKKNIRLGGLVVKGSLRRDGTRILFRVTDLKEEISVAYDGIPPDLFREGQGVVAEGMLREGRKFEARTLLAKHDENYMPPEVAKSLKKEP